MCLACEQESSRPGRDEATGGSRKHKERCGGGRGRSLRTAYLYAHPGHPRRANRVSAEAQAAVRRLSASPRRTDDIEVQEESTMTVVITGVGMTRFGRFAERPIRSLCEEAVREALADASIDG